MVVVVLVCHDPIYVLFTCYIYLGAQNLAFVYNCVASVLTSYFVLIMLV